MGLRDLLRDKAGEPKLYRKAWSETNNPLVAEARAQTLAIQRLQMWLRLAYSALALAALLGYWGFSEGGSMVAGVIGIILGVFALAITILLRVGITNGRANVNAMLEEIEQSRAS